MIDTGTKFVSAASLFTENPVDLFGWGAGKGLPVPVPKEFCSFQGRFLHFLQRV